MYKELPTAVAFSTRQLQPHLWVTAGFGTSLFWVRSSLAVAAELPSGSPPGSVDPALDLGVPEVVGANLRSPLPAPSFGLFPYAAEVYHGARGKKNKRRKEEVPNE